MRRRQEGVPDRREDRTHTMALDSYLQVFGLQKVLPIKLDADFANSTLAFLPNTSLEFNR